MNTEELIETFLESTTYYNDDNVLAIIVYGSRMYGTAHENSDLDILMLTSDFSSFRGRETIAGIVIDYFLIPVTLFEKRIMLSASMGDAYPKSVLKHGKVLKNRLNIVETLGNLLTSFSLVKKKITLNSVLITTALNELELFESGDEELIGYYNCLECLRQLLHAKNGWSNLPTKKVYDLYVNSTVARSYYELILPEEPFIISYINALKEETRNKGEILYALFEQLNINTSVRFRAFKENYSKGQIKSHLISLHDHIRKEEEYLLQEHPYAIAYYYLLIKEMKDLYERIELFPSQEFSLLCQMSKEANTIEKKIQSLEQLFSYLNTFFSLTFDRFLLKLDN